MISLMAKHWWIVAKRRLNGSVAALGAHRVVFLGYTDSGMTGWDQNSDPDCFFQAELADAAERLAVILREEDADVLTAYDWHGNYGHPDHIKVHEVGHAAVDLLISEGRGIRLFEATMNRDRVITMMQQAMEMGVSPAAGRRADGEAFDPAGPADDGNPFGMPRGGVDPRDRRQWLRCPEACCDRLSPQPEQRADVLPRKARGSVHRDVRD